MEKDVAVAEKLLFTPVGNDITTVLLALLDVALAVEVIRDEVAVAVLVSLPAVDVGKEMVPVEVLVLLADAVVVNESLKVLVPLADAVAEAVVVAFGEKVVLEYKKGYG